MFCNAFLIATNALVIDTLVCIAMSLRKTDASITTPCSVKAYGMAFLGRFDDDVITICDDILFHSSEFNRNMKSSGNRSMFLFTA